MNRFDDNEPNWMACGRCGEKIIIYGETGWCSFCDMAHVKDANGLFRPVLGEIEEIQIANIGAIE